MSTRSRIMLIAGLTGTLNIGAVCAVEIPKPVINISKPNIPTINVPRPTINVPRPNVTVNVPKPTINVPKPVVNVPKVNVPKVEISKAVVHVPKVDVAKPVVSAPKVDAPKPIVGAPKINTPRLGVNASKIDEVTPAITTPKIEAPKPVADVPKIEVKPTVQLPVAPPKAVGPVASPAAGSPTGTGTTFTVSRGKADSKAEFPKTGVTPPAGAPPKAMGATALPGASPTPLPITSTEQLNVVPPPTNPLAGPSSGNGPTAVVDTPKNERGISPKVIGRPANPPVAELPKQTSPATTPGSASSNAIANGPSAAPGGIGAPVSAPNAQSPKILNGGPKAVGEATGEKANPASNQVNLPNGTFGKATPNPDGTVTVSNNLGTVTLTKHEMNQVAAGDMSALKPLMGNGAAGQAPPVPIVGSNGNVTQVKLSNGTFGKAVTNPDGSVTVSNNLGTVNLTKQQMNQLAAGDMSALKPLMSNTQNGNASTGALKQPSMNAASVMSAQQGQGGENGKIYGSPPSKICPVQQCSSTVDEGSDGVGGKPFYEVNFKYSGETPPPPPAGMHYMESNTTGCGGGSCTLFLQFNSQTASSPSGSQSSAGGSLSGGLNAIANAVLPQAAAESPAQRKPGWQYVAAGYERVISGNYFELKHYIDYADENGQNHRIYDQPTSAAPGGNPPEPTKPNAPRPTPNTDGSGSSPPAQGMIGDKSYTCDQSGQCSSPDVDNGRRMTLAELYTKIAIGGAGGLLGGPGGTGGGLGGGGMGSGTGTGGSGSGGTGGGGMGSGTGTGGSGSGGTGGGGTGNGGTGGGGSGSGAAGGVRTGAAAGPNDGSKIPTAAACPASGCQGTGGYTYSEPSGGFQTNFSSLSEYITYLNSLPTPDMQQSFKNNTTGVLQQLLNQSRGTAPNGPVTPPNGLSNWDKIHNAYGSRNNAGEFLPP
ncbi:hypothetical protein [Bradyrhizobium guangdongense]